MEAQNKNNLIDYFDLKYKIHVPMGIAGYGMPSPYARHSKPAHYNEMAKYIFTSLYNRNLERGPSESIDEIFQDRMSLIRSKIELILLQLGQRKKINQEILYQIDLDSCKAQNLIFEMGHRAYKMDRDRIFLERIKLDLERQRRMEGASYFRDTGFLNKELKDTLIQYLDEAQKSSLIGMDGAL